MDSRVSGYESGREAPNQPYKVYMWLGSSWDSYVRLGVLLGKKEAETQLSVSLAQLPSLLGRLANICGMTETLDPTLFLLLPDTPP